MIEMDKCHNCGHDRQHHRTLGGVAFCNAVMRREIGKTILCECKRYEEGL
jgi:hypothetical protein